MASNEAPGEVKAGGVAISTRPAPSRPRPALSHRYVEDGLAPKTKLGACFSILTSTLLLTFQVSRGKEIVGHHLSGVQ